MASPSADHRLAVSASVIAAPGSVERFGVEPLVATVAGLLAGAGGLEDVLDRLLDVVHEANGGDLSDDLAILCLARAAGGHGHG